VVNLAIWYALAIKSFVRVVYVRLRDAEIKLVWKEHFIEKSFRRNARIIVIAKSDKEGLTKNESDAIHSSRGPVFRNGRIKSRLQLCIIVPYVIKGICLS